VLDTAALAAFAAVAGGVAATTARDGRIAVLGLMVAAVASSLVASPLPSSLAVTARILGAMLAAYLLWTAVGPGNVGSAGSAIGPLAEASAATAAFVAGLALRPVDPLAGPLAAQAAGFSLIVLSVVPLAGRDVFRMGMGVLLLALGGGLEMSAWSGAMPDLEQLALAALLVGIAGATSLLLPSVRDVAMAEETAEAGLTAGAAGEWATKLGPAAAPGPEARRIARPPRPEPATRPVPRRVDEAAIVAEPPPATPAPPEARPRPMTADPIEPDEWLAWLAPEPEPRRRTPRKLGSRPPGPGPSSGGQR